MTRACEQVLVVTKANGTVKHVKTFSYVVTLTEIGGDQVRAVRYDGYTSKYDLLDKLETYEPGWNIKGILKLYNEDFEGDNGL